jgi:hypothetical protein
MNAQLKALYELQQVDLQIAAAQKALGALDKGDALRRQLSEAEKRLGALSEELRRSEADLRDNDLKLKTVEMKKKSFEDKLYAGQVTNPKELSSMEKEIEMLGRTRSKLDERILELYDVVERQQGEANKSERAAAELKQRLEQQTAQHETRSRELNSELEQLARERQKALGGVTDRALLQRYETVRARYKDAGLAKVEDGKCGGCHISVTPYTVRMLKEDGQYQACESCGRILFLEE